MELTLIGNMTPSNTLLLEKTSGGEFCAQRSIKGIGTAECAPLQLILLLSFIF